MPPTLLLYGELDATIPRVAIDDLALRHDRVTVKLYPERHHLLLHEKGADAVLEDCLAWLALAAALTRGAPLDAAELSGRRPRSCAWSRRTGRSG